MPEQPPDTSNMPVPDAAVLTMQIITLALLGGVVAATGAFLVLRGGKPAENVLIPAVAASFLVVNLAMKFAFQAFVPAPKTSPKSPEFVQDECRLYQTRLIMGLGLIEGAVFFNLIAYLLEGYWWSLAVVGFGAAVMLLDFPTRAKVQEWLRRRAELYSLDNH